MSVNLFTSQIETIAMEAFQEGAHTIAQAFGLDTKEVAEEIRKKMDQVITDIAKRSYQRYRNPSLDALDPNTEEAIARLARNVINKKDELQVEVDTLAVAFNNPFNSLLRCYEFDKARDMLDIIPECTLRMRSAGALALAIEAYKANQ